MRDMLCGAGFGGGGGEEDGEQCTLRFVSTAKVLAECNLKYYIILECSDPPRQRSWTIS